MFKKIVFRKKLLLTLLLVAVLVVVPLASAYAQGGLPPVTQQFSVSRGGYSTNSIGPSNVLPGSNLNPPNCKNVADSWIVFNNVPANKFNTAQGNVLRVSSTDPDNQNHMNSQNPPPYGGLTGYFGNCSGSTCSVVLCGKDGYVFYNGWSYRLEIPDESPLVITNPSAVNVGLWATQCISGGRQKVWRVDANPNWATYLYSEGQYDACGSGSPSPLKFRTAYVTAGVWITQCTGSNHTRYVWKTDGSQYAPFQYTESVGATVCP